MIGNPGKEISRYFFLIGPPEQDIGKQDQAISQQRDPLGQGHPHLQKVDREQSEDNDRHQDGHIFKAQSKDP